MVMGRVTRLPYSPNHILRCLDPKLLLDLNKEINSEQFGELLQLAIVIFVGTIILGLEPINAMF